MMRKEDARTFRLIGHDPSVAVEGRWQVGIGAGVG